MGDLMQREVPLGPWRVLALVTWLRQRLPDLHPEGPFLTTVLAPVGPLFSRRRSPGVSTTVILAAPVTTQGLQRCFLILTILPQTTAVTPPTPPVLP